MKEITLSDGQTVLVDDSDYDRMSESKWYPKFKKRRDGSIKTVYARRNVYVNGKRTNQTMHRAILNILDPGVQIDHKDGNGLNCQKHNLRLATNEQNCRNQNKPINNTSGFKGVSWHKQRQKWVAYIKSNYRRIHLGVFEDRAEAAAAYDVAAIRLHGEFACLNLKLGKR